MNLKKFVLLECTLVMFLLTRVIFPHSFAYGTGLIGNAMMITLTMIYTSTKASKFSSIFLRFSEIRHNGQTHRLSIRRGKNTQVKSLDSSSSPDLIAL